MAAQNFEEDVQPPIVWVVWGGTDKRLNKFKKRFTDRGDLGVFFYCNKTAKIVSQSPTEEDFARHTQGLTKRPIVEHLAKCL